MKLRKVLPLVILIGALSAAGITSASAQQHPFMWRGGGGWGADGTYMRLYNPQTVETVSGVVVSIDEIRPMRGMHYGVHLTLKTDKGEIAIHLGPGWYLENQDVKIARNDKIEVKGSRITFQGKPAIVAGQVKKGDEILVLRDADGFPAWAGWRHR